MSYRCARATHIFRSITGQEIVVKNNGNPKTFKTMVVNSIADLDECTTCGTPLCEQEHKLSRQNRFKKYQEKSIFRAPLSIQKQKAKKSPLKLFVDSIDWINVFILTFVPAMALYGLLTTAVRWETVALSFAWYLFSGFGITAGYHRCFSHKAYKAHWLLRLWWLCAGAAAVQGSAKWWSLGHRAHHRYTDTEKDPYNSVRGFMYAHMGWLIMKQDHKRIGRVNIDDLNADKMVVVQHKHYLKFALFFAILLPAIIAHYGWGDFYGGLFFAGFLRLLFVQHSTFCVNSLAHFWGSTSYDDVLTPRDSIVTALITLGEGYHNFHHEFPNDYRNAIRWYQYDPTKWCIWLASCVGLAYDLNQFPENEIQKGKLAMQMKKLNAKRARLDWGVRVQALPVWSMERVQNEIKQDPARRLIVVDNLVHDVTQFAERHPGGAAYFNVYNGKDATAAFDGDVYNHTTAARNILSHFRVAKLPSKKVKRSMLTDDGDAEYEADEDLMSGMRQRHGH